MAVAIKTMNNKFLVLLTAIIVMAVSCNQSQENSPKTVTSDPLPSWNEGVAKQAILDFVTKTTTDSSSGFIPVADRIACFDNDGTLWSEHPMYFQLYFAIDRIKAMAPQHPGMENQTAFQSIA